MDMMFGRGFAAAPRLLAGASGGPPSDPVTRFSPAIFLPADQYLHRGAPSEWWWHVGTLQAAGDRVFGFEINAAAFASQGYAFSQIMLSDIANAKHYQRTTPYLPPFGVDFDNWAQHDVTKDWHVGLGNTAQSSYVTMDAAWGDPTQNMAVKARLVDDPTNTQIDFDLMLSQQGPPFLVWGSGVQPAPGQTGTHLQTNNYYYSLARLAASGTITVAGETFAVAGTTWMDHEYGLFGTAQNPVKWILQDAQLDNGWVMSNFVVGDKFEPGKTVQSFVTLQDRTGRIFTDSAVALTPTAQWRSPVTGSTYFTAFKIDIKEFGASLVVKSLIDNQEFVLGKSHGIYEGAAAASGTFLGQPVSGTAWNEQAL
jgi:predicted secreted hydrolase